MSRLVLIAALALVAAACGSVAERVVENAVENNAGIENVEIDQDSGEISIEFDDEDGSGSLTFGGGEIPDGFPIPLPDGGQVVAVIEQGDFQTVSLTYPGDRYDDVVEFFQEWADGLPGQTDVSTSTGSFQSASFINADAEMVVSVTLSGSETSVTANVGS